jgi:hypothetical protein
VAVEPLEGRTLLASNWTAVTAAPSTIGTMMLLTDGTVIAQQAGITNTWFKLTPNSSGSYVNGTWSTIATMNVSRLYFGSNVLQNGNVFVVGGEYSNGQNNWTNTGEIYNSALNSWAPITNFPNSQFGDDPTQVLETGNILSGYLSGPQTYLYNPSGNSWSATGTKQGSDRSDEEGWIKLPDDSILSYNVFSTGNGLGSAPNAGQRYYQTGPNAGTWVTTGTVPVSLSNNAVGAELGPAVLLPNGKVFQAGGNNNTAIYDPSTDTWATGPVMPGGLAADDSAGVLLPNGQFLFTADTPLFHNPAHILDYDYGTNTITDVTPTVANGDPADLVTQLTNSPSFTSRFLMLPTGQALYTAGGGSTIYVYTPSGLQLQSSAPTIGSITANGNNSYTLTGSQLNGASEGASYGDDAEMSTNYPIVSVLTNAGTTYYARTTNWNRTGVGVTNGSTSTNFSLPAALSQAPVISPIAISPAESQALSNIAVATFTDPNGTHTGQYSATITWGDGAQTAGTISGPVNGVYTISGSHTYTEEGPETLAISVTDNYVSGSLTVSASGVKSSSQPFSFGNTNSTGITVTDPSVVGSGGLTINAVVGTSTGTVTLATFTDPAGAETLADYSASVSWGDGTSGATITGPVAGVFTVSGSHTYSAAGAFNVAITINHDASTPTVVNDTADVASTVTNVTSSTPNGTYGVNKVILIQVTFNATETVTGVPKLALNSGGTANYTSGSGSNTLTFTYTVGAGDSSAHLDYTSANALTLNGGTINGPGNIPAVLTLPAPGAAGSLGANKNIVIDTVAPTVVSYNVLFGNGQSFNLANLGTHLDVPWEITGINVVFSKPIATADLNSLSATGLTTTSVTGLGTASLTWTIAPITVGVFNTDLHASGPDEITDAAGNLLSGGTDFLQGLTVLLGDFNGDKSVTSADLSGVNLARSQSYNIFADINGDGSVTTTDVLIVRAQLGSFVQ